MKPKTLEELDKYISILEEYIGAVGNFHRLGGSYSGGNLQARRTHLRNALISLFEIEPEVSEQSLAWPEDVKHGDIVVGLFQQHFVVLYNYKKGNFQFASYPSLNLWPEEYTKETLKHFLKENQYQYDGNILNKLATNS